MAFIGGNEEQTSTKIGFIEQKKRQNGSNIPAKSPLFGKMRSKMAAESASYGILRGRTAAESASRSKILQNARKLKGFSC